MILRDQSPRPPTGASRRVSAPRILILAIDQGSSSTKAGIYDPITTRRIGFSRAPVRSISPTAILSSVKSAARGAWADAMNTQPMETGDARLVVAIANQRSTLVFLRNNESPSQTGDPSQMGDPFPKLVPWWEKTGLSRKDVSADVAAEFRAATGLPLLPNWWAGKVSRHFTHHPSMVTSSRPCTIDTLLAAWLTDGRTFATDLSNAARTGLVDIRRGRRTRALRALFALPQNLRLAGIRASDAGFGKIDPRRLGLPATLHGRIAVMVGDAGAGCLGASGGAPGELVLTLGTGGFLHLPCLARTKPPHGIYKAPAWQADGKIRWTLEASLPGMARALQLGGRAAGLTTLMMRSLTPTNPGSLRCVLAPDGMGALGPEHVSGIFLVGSWRHASAAARLGALFDYLALAVTRAVRKFPIRPTRLVAGGGLASGGYAGGDYLLQRIADFTGRPVLRLANADTTLHGAAMLAGRTCGEKIPPLPFDAEFRPRITATARRRALDALEQRLARCLTATKL